jgi:hypothetical protein
MLRPGIEPSPMIVSSHFPPGVSIQTILWSAIRSVVWEFLNSNRDLRELVKPLISPLSAINPEYSHRQDAQHRQQLLNTTTSSSAFTQQPDALQLTTHEEQQQEREIILSTFVPAHIISTCLRNLCTNPDLEKKLINQLDHFFHFVMNKNIRSSTSESTGTERGGGGGEEFAVMKRKYEKLMRPNHMTDVKIRDLIDFFESKTSPSAETTGDGGNNNTGKECAHLLLVEQRKLTKKLNQYLYKSRETEMR